MSKNEKKKFDFYNYLIGNWKRTLETREFGGLFQHIKNSNLIINVKLFKKI